MQNVINNNYIKIYGILWLSKFLFYMMKFKNILIFLFGLQNVSNICERIFFC